MDTLPDWIRRQGDKEDDRILINESFDSKLSELLIQTNDDVALQVDILSMTFHER